MRKPRWLTKAYWTEPDPDRPMFIIESIEGHRSSRSDFSRRELEKQYSKVISHACAPDELKYEFIFIGGPFDRDRGKIKRIPPRISIKDVIYSRLDDPDTGDFLGAYVHGEAEIRNDED